MKKNDDFELMNRDLPKECKDPEISKDDFVLTTVDGKVHEQKFQTKPTTFLKDSLKRFKKNKSSVVAGYILGVLILLAIIVPIASPWDVSKSASDTGFYNLEPKLFENANGFWDGTVKKDHIAVDSDTNYPDPDIYPANGVKNITYEPEQYTDTATKFGKDGYAEVGYYSVYSVDSVELSSPLSSGVEIELGQNIYSKPIIDVNNMDLTLTKFETVDADKITAYQALHGGPKLPSEVTPSGFELGNVVLNFNYIDDGGNTITIPLTENKMIHNTGSELDVSDKEEINLIEKIIAAAPGVDIFTDFNFSVVVTASSGVLDASYCALIKNLVINATTTLDSNVGKASVAYFNGYTRYATLVPGISFDDATEFNVRSSKISLGKNLLVPGFWGVPDLTRFNKSVYLSKSKFASFTFDSYEANLGLREDFLLDSSIVNKYKNKKYFFLDFDIEKNPSGEGYIVENFEFYPGPNWKSCPVKSEITKEDIINPTFNPDTGGESYTVRVDIVYYKYLGYDKMPTFLLGTDKTGKDMFTYVFEGLRNSLLLGFCTFLVCFIFGLIYGSISGYFGGAVDLIMERITDILSGIPWIVVMTLVILKSGQQNFGTLALALCLTGWIGTAALTRTQFYRFRGREYVLASRTLGASHARLITKHILPNAMGTIITSCVLMIPFIIFEEATISYLGLGFKGLSSLGVILSDNQAELLIHPYQLIFPSIVIALVMISFNLFGNGLRDAINPSLKGEEE